MIKGIDYLAVLAAAWSVYCAVHSVLAADRTKAVAAKIWPSITPYYRLLYNLLALVFLIAPLYYTLAWDGPRLWQWHGVAAWVADGLALAALAGFLWSLRYYSASEFLGLQRRRAASAQEQQYQALTISPLHRHVRHPWYFFALVILWTRDMDAARLVATIVISAYFVVGSWLEERKLIGYYGEAYRLYRRNVAGLVPLPWRRLSRSQAEMLVALSREHRRQAG